jgi:hypothetical protein
MLRINSPCRYRPLSDFLSFAAPYRIAMAPQQGRKVFTLQTLPDCGNDQFASRLVSLVPKPRVNLTRFHGVFAPNSKYRTRVTPAQRGKGSKTKTEKEAQDQSPAEKRASMTWAMRLKRVFTKGRRLQAISTSKPVMNVVVRSR